MNYGEHDLLADVRTAMRNAGLHPAPVSPDNVWAMLDACRDLLAALDVDREASNRQEDNS